MTVALRDTARRGSAQVTTLPRPCLRSSDEAFGVAFPEAMAQTKAFACEVAVAVASDLFSMSGASAADEKYDLGRYWRNARTHASHDPVDWKYHHVGNYLLRGMLPPNHGQL
jgi:alkylation response protein AidB-like acyl-CoA dehydrogenase